MDVDHRKLPPGAEVVVAGSALESGRKLARIIVRKMVVPLIIAGLLELDEVIELIKREVVAALSGTGETQAFLAGHVARSRRWFQDYARRLRTEQEDSAKAYARPVEGGTDGTEDDSLDLMSRVLLALSTVYPESLSLSQLRELAQVPSWDMPDPELIRRIEFYSKLEALEVVGHDSAGPQIRASQKIPQVAVSHEQIEWLGERLGWVVPLAYAYCEGQGEFGGIVAELSPKALQRARQKLKEATADIIAEAVAETHKSDEPRQNDVKVRAIIAIGTREGFDGQ